MRYFIDKNLILRFRDFIRQVNGGRGFGLMEALIAVFVLVFGTSGAMSLVSQGINNLAISKNRLIAINLAQEGLEVTHNIRDNNWLAEPVRDWNSWKSASNDPSLPPWGVIIGLPDCSVACYVLWNSQSLTDDLSFKNLKMNSGTMHYDNVGTIGKEYSRIIKITENADGDFGTVDAGVRATVGWGGAGSCGDTATKYCIVLEEVLYQWR